jgi:hypothetical protein
MRFYGAEYNNIELGIRLVARGDHANHYATDAVV